MRLVHVVGRGINHLANKFVRGNPSLRKEADDAAIDGLMLAAAAHKEGSSACFKTFATLVIRQRRGRVLLRIFLQPISQVVKSTPSWRLSVESSGCL
jgi:hypothetical protein